MNIFLRRIPANTKHVEISEFIAPALKNGIFGKPGRILNIEILALRDVRAGTVEYHGLVTLDSESTVQRAVNGLKNRRLNGRYVLVRPYYHRSWYNDPRQRNDNENPAIVEKRKSDRRRGKDLEVIKNITDQFNSEDDFFNAVNHRQFLVTFIVPAEVEIEVAECFVSFEMEKSNPTTTGIQDHWITRFLTEQECPEKKSRRFQLFATKNDTASLVEKLKQRFPGTGIHYWITPVIESGEI